VGTTMHKSSFLARSNEYGVQVCHNPARKSSQNPPKRVPLLDAAALLQTWKRVLQRSRCISFVAFYLPPRGACGMASSSPPKSSSLRHRRVNCRHTAAIHSDEPRASGDVRIARQGGGKVRHRSNGNHRHWVAGLVDRVNDIA
jgi:hypothetical protein